MNEQEKEFMAFVEWLPKNIKKFANAKPEDIVAYLTKLSETPEGKNEFNALVTEYKKSKQNIPMAQKGMKIDYFVKKFYTGGQIDKDTVEVHNKMFLTPMWMSIAAATGVDVPRMYPNQDRRQFKYIKSNLANNRYGVIQNKRTGGYTIFELDENNEPIKSSFGGNTYYPGDEMFDRHVRNYKHYTRDIVIPSDKKGGKIDYLNSKFNEGDKIQTRYNGGNVEQPNLFDKLKM